MCDRLSGDYCWFGQVEEGARAIGIQIVSSSLKVGNIEINGGG